MNEDNGFALTSFPAAYCHTRRETNAQQIYDGVEAACLEILGRIERTKETATNKELIDLSVCLSGLITAWNLVSLHGGYTAWSSCTTGFDDEGVAT